MAQTAAFLALGLASLGGAARGARSSPPDLILIFADDMGWGDLGANWDEPSLGAS